MSAEGERRKRSGQLRRRYRLALARIRDLEHGLTESVKLQSFYAGLLNGYDGGARRQFASGQAWLDRLAEVEVPLPAKGSHE